MSDVDLETIFAHGNRHGPYGADGKVSDDNLRMGPNVVVCRDGFIMSVIAGWGAYCSPRPGMLPGHSSPPGFYDVPYGYPGPYREVECGFPSERPEPWERLDGEHYWRRYAEDEGYPTDTVYPYVPVPMVRALMRLHGGVERLADKLHEVRDA